MSWLFMVFVIAIGAGLPLQALVNARLGDLTAGPMYAAALSVMVGMFVLGLILLSQRPAWPSPQDLIRLPPWIWIGGLIGAAYVAAAILGVPRIGAAGFVALIVLGQMIGSLILDHYGILHPPQPASLVRVFGVVLVTAGMLLVLQPWRH